jgi:hypothetical protein
MGNSFRQTVAGIFSNPKMNTAAMLEGHLSNTLQRAGASSGEYLIAAQDTAHYNYSGHKQMAGLGAIQGDVRGIMQHNVLLMDDLGHPLGLLGQQYWTRKGGRDFGGKESLKWANGLGAVNRHLGASGKKVVLVQDREADIFDFFRAGRAPCVDLLVRVHQPRNMEVLAGHVVAKLDTAGGHLPDFGTKEVLLQRNHREVKLTLRLKAGAVDVLSDKNRSERTQGLSLVVAEEVACVDSATGESTFNETDRAVWYLLTSLPVENGADVERVVRFYALRWRVERLHYTLKSGALNVEKLQFDDIHSMVNALGFYSIVAWQLLALAYFIRQGAEVPAGAVFEAREVEILEKISGKNLQTVKQAVLALARTVGFAPSKKQPFPGVKVLALALERFYFIKLGAWASQTKPLQD